jgi:polyisoprenoid-binding protein YceI
MTLSKKWIYLGAIAGLSLGCGTPSSVPMPQVPPETPELVQEQRVTMDVDATIAVVAVKDSIINVNARFPSVTGQLSMVNVATWGGLAGELTIPLEQWTSENELRDQRVREVLFNTEESPSAFFEVTSIDGIPTGGIGVGAMRRATLRGEIRFADSSQEVLLPIEINRIGERRFEFESVSPGIVSVESVHLGAALRALIRLCGHQSVEDTVSVNISGRMGVDLR